MSATSARAYAVGGGRKGVKQRASKASPVKAARPGAAPSKPATQTHKKASPEQLLQAAALSIEDLEAKAAGWRAQASAAEVSSETPAVKLYSALSSLSTPDVFRPFDSNGNGELTQLEFRKACRKLNLIGMADAAVAIDEVFRILGSSSKDLGSASTIVLADLSGGLQLLKAHADAEGQKRAASEAVLAKLHACVSLCEHAAKKAADVQTAVGSLSRLTDTPAIECLVGEAMLTNEAVQQGVSAMCDVVLVGSGQGLVRTQEVVELFVRSGTAKGREQELAELVFQDLQIPKRTLKLDELHLELKRCQRAAEQWRLDVQRGVTELAELRRASLDETAKLIQMEAAFTAERAALQAADSQAPQLQLATEREAAQTASMAASHLACGRGVTRSHRVHPTLVGHVVGAAIPGTRSAFASRPAAGVGSAPKTHVFCSADVGRRVSIVGDQVFVDGQSREVEWWGARHCDVDDLLITDVQARLHGVVTLEDRSTFENPPAPCPALVRRTSAPVLVGGVPGGRSHSFNGSKSQRVERQLVEQERQGAAREEQQRHEQRITTRPPVHVGVKSTVSLPPPAKPPPPPKPPPAPSKPAADLHKLAAPPCPRPQRQTTTTTSTPHLMQHEVEPADILPNSPPLVPRLNLNVVTSRKRT